ncbi:hypothetical protein BD626DRAFT_164038 [Schizophyllum amplum]|uniref:FIST domain-containing protein n=1 Tax=Schizophyllum amplum TaxID=97359 RepID=A0A550CPS9_9AGAR|nr:hypothetical protein BD626DRAFT_164038 [Auriculariopsis ampla]
MPLLSHASTYITRSRNPALVLNYLSGTVPALLGGSAVRPTVLLALGICPDDADLARDHSSALSDLVKYVHSWTAHADVVGCITAPPRVGGNASDALSCALAVFPSTAARAFRVDYDEDGRVRVGRWHAFGPQSTGPQETIEGIRSEELVNKNLITLSASLTLPNAITRGRSLLNLHTSATPFLTGLPHTLFFGKRIHERGCVGIALDADRPGEVDVKSDFAGMRRVDGELYTVTEADGNLITGLSGEKPTHHFLQAARKAGAAPAASLVEDQGFALGVVTDASEGTVTQMHSIISSDPSRGTLALEEGAYIPPGRHVAFFVREPSPSELGHDWLKRPARPTISFLNPSYVNPNAAYMDFSAMQKAEGDFSSTPHLEDSSATDITLPNTFLASSEEGFSMTEGGRCRIGDAVGSMSFGEAAAK